MYILCGFEIWKYVDGLMNHLEIIVISYTKQKHLGAKEGKANQKQQLSDYCD